MTIALTLTRKITAGFTLALLVTVLVCGMAYWNARNYIDSAALVTRTHRSTTLLQELIADVVSAESEARGFVITGREEFLTLYLSAVKDAEVALADLRANVRDEVNLRRIDELERLMHERFERLRLTLDTRRLEGLEAVPRISGPGKKLMDELRRVASAIEQRQRLLLDQRNERARVLADRTIATALTAGILAAAVALLGIVLLRADLAERERLEREVLEIAEREQRRIGQDLHDGLCQELTGISLLSRSLQQQVTGTVRDDLGKMTGLINECIDQTRRVTRGLHPVPNEPTGLQLALAELAESVTMNARVPCQLDCPAPVPIPNQAAGTNLYRIAQEAVQNALRHAKATQIVIGLRMDEARITLSVQDDGRGLPSERSGPGLGLEIMKYRANTLGASLSIAPGSERGTCVTCVLPRHAID